MWKLMNENVWVEKFYKSTVNALKSFGMFKDNINLL